MKIEDAIKHAEYRAEEHAENSCGKEHLQLAQWLKLLVRFVDEAKLDLGIFDSNCPKECRPGYLCDGVGGCKLIPENLENLLKEYDSISDCV